MKEDMKVTYHQDERFLFPDLTIRESSQNPRTVGKYGLVRKTYLKNHRPAQYEELLFNGRLVDHLADIDAAATDRFVRLTDQLAKVQGITEGLKAENMLLWIQRMNAVRDQADEIVLRELVYQ